MGVLSNRNHYMSDIAFDAHQERFHAVMTDDDVSNKQWNLSTKESGKKKVTVCESKDFMFFQLFELNKIVKVVTAVFHQILGVRFPVSFDAGQRNEVYELGKKLEQKIDSFDEEVKSLNLISWIFVKVASWWVGYDENVVEFRVDLRRLEAVRNAADAKDAVVEEEVDTIVCSTSGKKVQFGEDPVEQVIEIEAANNGRKVGKLYT